MRGAVDTGVLCTCFFVLLQGRTQSDDSVSQLPEIVSRSEHIQYHPLSQMVLNTSSTMRVSRHAVSFLPLSSSLAWSPVRLQFSAATVDGACRRRSLPVSTRK